MKGWVYVITNAAMPGLVKVGYSDRDPENRAKELDGTHSPHPHIVEFAGLVDNARSVEHAVHRRLESNLERKEWFKCSVATSITAINEIAKNCVVTHAYKLANQTKAYPTKRTSNSSHQPSKGYCIECGKLKPRNALAYVDSKFMCKYGCKTLCSDCGSPDVSIFISSGRFICERCFRAH